MPKQTRSSPRWKHILITVLVLVLQACSNGSGTGIGGTGYSGEPITTTGVITGFGSIIVNGIEFETTRARISVDDAPADEADLKLGMVVTVSGVLAQNATDRALAERVIFDDDVQGPVEAITDDPGGQYRILTVLNRRIRVDRTETVFDHVDFDTIAVGDLVEVSGFPDADGTLRATRIDKKAVFVPGGSRVEIKGTVSNLAGNNFTLGRYSIDFTSADLSEVPGGRLVNGLTVEVEGTLSGERITALRIEQEDDDDLFDDDGGKVKVEGIITDFRDIGQFRIGAVTVDASAARLEPADLPLRNGIRLEVEGVMVGGVLKATEVSAYMPNVVIEAQVVAVNRESGQLSMGYVPGSLTIQTTQSTRWDDDDDFDIDTVREGEFLEIYALADGNGAITASRIERITPDDDVIQGPASNCSPGQSITILGLDFVLDDDITEYEGNDEELPSAASFCRELAETSAFVTLEDDHDHRDGVADEVELAD